MNLAVAPLPSSVDSAEPSSSSPALREAPKPVLASELFAEEMAPLEPARHACRVWLVLIAAGVAAVGLGLRLGLGIPRLRLEGATLSFAAAAAVAALALLPFAYRARAWVAVSTGVLLMGLGLRNVGPLAGLAFEGAEWRQLARLVALSVLPAALALRARYPAYRPLRLVLGAALGCAGPFAVLEMTLALNPGVDPLVRLLASLCSAVVAIGLVGLLPDGLTRAGRVWAGAILLVLPAEIAIRELTLLGGGDAGLLTYPTTALAMLCAGLLTTLGGYQLVAQAVAPRARARLKSGPSPRLNVVKR
jgi:hypothetical protein